MKFSQEQQDRIVNQLMDVVYPKLPLFLDRIAALDKMSNDEKVHFVAFQQEIVADIAAAFGLGGIAGKLAMGPLLLAAKSWLGLNKDKMRTQIREALNKQ